MIGILLAGLRPVIKYDSLATSLRYMLLENGHITIATTHSKVTQSPLATNTHVAITAMNTCRLMKEGSLFRDVFSTLNGMIAAESCCA